ncbi:phage integrase N-terminal domain-containing protein [Bradyrhizobium sp. 188]|uniref:phage integrase N-terminal domain-containing protein n=1 Tax=Bradyrhizobium sp. 188 TaxID=2782656 RepID=UPI001FF968BA|nr:integrase domain-containing protein [Bradyrhizobium sp. 188]
MDALAYDLKNLTLKAEGSHLTRTQRHRGLQAIARDLRGLGFALPGAASLKPKHIEALVAHWKAARLTPGTLKNRMGWVRWWAQSVRKASVLPRDNASVGIPIREGFKGSKAQTTMGQKMSALPDRMQLALRLQMAFGLRLEESLKFRVGQADHGDHIALQASWCKGGRSREVALTHSRQRALLDEVRTVCGNGAIIPQSKSYIEFRKEVEHATWRAGIHNMHGHRHWYAQWRYRVLTGRPSPAAGGETYERLSRGERARDYWARLQISRELGHNRLQVTDIYLGGRFAAKGRAR